MFLFIKMKKKPQTLGPLEHMIMEVTDHSVSFIDCSPTEVDIIEEEEDDE